MHREACTESASLPGVGANVLCSKGARGSQGSQPLKFFHHRCTLYGPLELSRQSNVELVHPPARHGTCCDYVSEPSRWTKALISVVFVGRSFNRSGTSLSDIRSVIHEAVSNMPSSIIRTILGNWFRLLRLA